MDNKDLMQISGALEECIEKYILERRLQIQPFVERHFSIQETFEIQKNFFWADLLFNPLNALWSVPYLFTKKIVESLDKVGWSQLTPHFMRLPSGFKTQYQSEIESLIVKEVLGGDSAENGLYLEMRGHPVLAPLLNDKRFSNREYTGAVEIQLAMHSNSTSRMMLSDLAGSLLTLTAGWLFFGDHSLGVLGLGDRLARKLARDRAVSDFFLGEGLGTAFYRIFPPQPTVMQLVLATGIVGLMLTVFSHVAGILTDPLRKKLGLHDKKLHALLDDLEDRLMVHMKRRFKAALKNL